MAGRLYLDASALVKLVIEERESRALLGAVEGSERTSSAVAGVEVRLAARRSGIARAEEIAEEVLDTVAPIRLTDDLARRAGRLDSLRALDAIHLASALSIESSVEGFVAYDRRLRRAAADAGLAVVTPA